MNYHMSQINQVLTIAGSDSSGGAGIQADIKTVTMLENYAASVITAVTAQNTQGVRGVSMLDGEFVKEQLETILNDLDIKAIKTGMLGTSEIIEIIASIVEDRELENLVVDPVMVATSGDRLLDVEAEDLLKARLLPLATVVTPNIEEAKVLIDREVSSPEDMEYAAKQISQLGPTAVLLKGGHSTGEEAVDLLYYDKEIHYLSAARINTTNTHGTGCTLSAAIASNLANGMEVVTAVKEAKDFITNALRNAKQIGRGNGPVNHLWKFDQK